MNQHKRFISDIRLQSSDSVTKETDERASSAYHAFVLSEEMFPEEEESSRYPHEIRGKKMDNEQKKERLFSRLRHPFFILPVVICILIGGMVVTREVRAMKDALTRNGEEGFRELVIAAEDMKNGRFDESLLHFRRAEQFFAEGEKNLSFLRWRVCDVFTYIPGLSQAISGKYALKAGAHFAAAGIPLSSIAEEVSSSKEAYVSGEQISFLEFFQRIDGSLGKTITALEQGNEALARVRVDDIPTDKQQMFLLAREQLPLVMTLAKKIENNETLLEELLGGNGPRKYLFLLQNNHELRATGGFIGSYGLLDVNDGVVRKFFVDGIFNPDGQLKENIVPPQPIQKISAAWSLHDSNWFPDFPTSAEKAIFFYEKTGGPTVDGVIALTPTVMQKLFAVVGPITLPQYGITVDAENFIPVIQEQVEVKYNREENKPKKVLADLSVALLEKVFASQDKKTLLRVTQALVEGLNEKHLLLYARHEKTQALIDAAGWSGRVLDTPRDYLSVVHTNINGYKTDGVIDEVIRHRADIEDDGSIIDTVTITRTHRGGRTAYDWWNKVNADYLRVYVPEGSILLSAQGTTWEFPEPPLDYEALSFRRDQDVEREEKSMTLEKKSGTRVSKDAGKTVFGAWVYVSPQESVTVEYRYRLPFSLRKEKIENDAADTYSVLYQKQSGSFGSKLFSSVVFPKEWQVIWQTDGNLIPYGREWSMEKELTADVFAGMVFGVAR
ncbi:MAG: DUF4012 domain-containing protein [Candidatus Moranbacteria bacterium]|nr:DUF4012 domain-containing protein [Candidatus Moranbacteria bacterium]